MSSNGGEAKAEREVLDAAGIDAALERLADEIVASIADAAGDRGMPHPVSQPGAGTAPEREPPMLIGVLTGGAVLAARLRSLLSERLKVEVPLGEIDIALYRDDAFGGLAKPVVRPAKLPVSVEGRSIILVDDVLFTGRTIRAALDELIDFGRPRRVRLVVLVDRGMRELPIRADHAGMDIEARPDEQVRVRLRETGGDDRVVVIRRSGA